MLKTNAVFGVLNLSCCEAPVDGSTESSQANELQPSCHTKKNPIHPSETQLVSRERKQLPIPGNIGLFQPLSLSQSIAEELHDALKC